MEPSINHRHELFAQALIKHGGNMVQAYMSVYNKAKYNSARHSASLLLTNVYIKQRIYEILEQNGLGLQEVIKKLSEFMNAKYYYRNEKGENVLKDNKHLQLKGLTLALRLYEVLIKPETIICASPEEADQLKQITNGSEQIQKKQDNETLP